MSAATTCALCGAKDAEKGACARCRVGIDKLSAGLLELVRAAVDARVLEERTRWLADAETAAKVAIGEALSGFARASAPALPAPAPVVAAPIVAAAPRANGARATAAREERIKAREQQPRVRMIDLDPAPARAPEPAPAPPPRDVAQVIARPTPAAIDAAARVHAAAVQAGLRCATCGKPSTTPSGACDECAAKAAAAFGDDPRARPVAPAPRAEPVAPVAAPATLGTRTGKCEKCGRMKLGAHRC